MPPTRTTKPLKPYRRGETLGKASRAAKVPKPAKQEGKPKGAEPTGKGKEKAKEPPVVSGTGDYDGDSEEEEGAGEAEDQDGAEGQPAKRPRGKKGKKFVESQDALLSLVASITGETESKRKAQVAKVKKHQKVKEQRKKVGRADQKANTLEAAKALVVKARAERKAPPPAPTEADEGRKRVSFA